MADEIGSVKFPCQLESCGFRRGTQDWGISFASPQTVRKYTQPLDRFLNKWAVVVVFPVTSQEQAQSLLEREETPPLLPETDQELSIECTRDQLAEDFSLQVNQINVLARAGIVVKLTRGQYDYRASAKGYIKELRRQAIGKGTGDYQQERAKRAAIQREQDEITLLERKRLLLPAEGVKKGITEYLGIVVNKLKALPSNAETPEEQEKLERTVRECCIDLARIDVGEIISNINGGDMDATEKVKRKPMGRGRKGTKPKDKRGAGKMAKRKNTISR